MKYKIVYDRKNCIGAGECELMSPELWKMTNVGKADLINAIEKERGTFELDISEEEYKKQQDVVSSCPARCIKLVKEE